MNNLNLLVKEYKATGNQDVFKQIYDEVKKNIEARAKFTYYRQHFSIRGKALTLSEAKIVDYDDVLQSYLIELLRIINTYDPSKGTAFSTYLYGTLKHLIPHDIEKEIQTKNNLINESDYFDEDSEQSLEKIAGTCEPDWDIDRIRDSNIKLTKREDEVLQLLLERKVPKQIATKLNLSKSRISRIIKNINKKVNDL